jgi:hypothetical protein
MVDLADYTPVSALEELNIDQNLSTKINRTKSTSTSNTSGPSPSGKKTLDDAPSITGVSEDDGASTWWIWVVIFLVVLMFAVFVFVSGYYYLKRSRG